jgi:photosystem II stability/assembly factor-like uncharacterized protein
MYRIARGGFAVVLLCLLLVACGGSSSSGYDSPPTTLPASIYIQASPQAESGASVSFTTSLTQTDGITFQWVFGDGMTGTGPAPMHVYAKSGTYDVTVSVANTARDRRSARFALQVGNFSNVAGLECTQNDGGWCWQGALVTPHPINDAWFPFGQPQAWAVGQAGTIVVSTDGGDTWTNGKTGVTDNIVAVRFRDALHGFALTEYRGLLTEDGGRTWSPVEIAGMSPVTTQAIVAYDASQLVVTTSGTATFSSHDDGKTWSRVSASGGVFVVGLDCWIANGALLQVSAGCTAAPSTVLDDQNGGFFAGSFITPQMGLVLSATWDPDLISNVLSSWATSDGGKTWSTTDIGLEDRGWPARARMMDASHIVLTWDAYPGSLSLDGGRTWSELTVPVDMAGQPLRSGLLEGTTQAWYATRTMLAVTEDYGDTWREAPAPEASLSPVRFARVVKWSGANDIVAAVNDRYYVTHDAGLTWKRVLGLDGRDGGVAYSDIAFTDAKHGAMAMSNGTIETTSDGGQSWSRKDFGTSGGLALPVALQFVSPNEAWLLTDGHLAHTPDAGATWTVPALPASMTSLASMHWVDATNGWAANYDLGGLFVTVNGGVSWQPMSLPDNSGSVTSMAFESPKTGVVVAGWQAFRTTDGGAHWQPIPASQGAMRVIRTDAHTFWLLCGSSVGRSTDDGATWKMHALPSTMSYPDLSASDSQHAMLATGENMLLVTADGGNTWTAQTLPPDISFTSVFSFDTTTAWAVTRDGQVMATATGGH